MTEYLSRKIEEYIKTLKGITEHSVATDYIYARAELDRFMDWLKDNE